MKLRTVTTVAIVAAATMGLTLAALWPASLSANAPAKADGPKRKIPIPTLIVDGCKLTLQPAVAKYQPNDCPELVLKAVNPTDKPVTFEAMVFMMSMGTPSRMARMIPMPKEVWKESCEVSLAPGATRIVRLPTGTKIAAGQTISFRLAVGKATISVPGFTLPRAKLLVKPVKAPKLVKAGTVKVAAPAAPAPAARQRAK